MGTSTPPAYICKRVGSAEGAQARGRQLLARDAYQPVARTDIFTAGCEASQRCFSSASVDAPPEARVTSRATRPRRPLALCVRARRAVGQLRDDGRARALRPAPAARVAT
jgi:hypothetical protein